MKNIGLMAISLVSFMGYAQVTGLAVNQLASPTDVNARPTFSWRMESTREGARQIAYRLRVAEARSGREVWDSLVVTNAISVGIGYDGAPLESQTRYRWEVSVLDDLGKWSKAIPGEFATGILRAEEWQKSQWIRVDHEYRRPNDSERRSWLSTPGASVFEKTLDLGEDVAEVWWTVTANGVFEAYANGTRVGEDALKPGLTHFAKTRHAYTYELTPIIGKAKSVRLTATVTSGWWRDMGLHYRGTNSAFRALLKIRRRDGSELIAGTDLSWQGAVTGPVVKAGIFDGEEYDARLESSGFKPVKPDGEFKGAIIPVEGPKMRLREELALLPRTAYVWSKVTGAARDRFGTVVKDREGWSHLDRGEHLVLDFGQNSTAVPRFRARAKAGTRLEIRFAEALNESAGLKSRHNDGPEGSVYLENLRELKTSAARVGYAFAGKGTEEYITRFSFFGYRYMSITATGPVDFERIESVPLTSLSAEAEALKLTTGDASLNQFISNVKWGMRSNYLSIPMDCPQRNERQGWTGDTQVFAPAACYSANVYGFLSKWMRDMRDSVNAEGSFVSVAPPGSFDTDLAERIGYTDAGVIVPYWLWRMHGETAVVSDNWETMSVYARLINRTWHTGEGGDQDQWADWLSFEKLGSRNYDAFESDEKGGLKPKPEAQRYWRFLGGCYALGNDLMLVEMARGIGNAEAAKEFSAAAEDVRGRLRREFLDDDGMLPPFMRDMQTPALFALKYALFTDRKAEWRTRRELLENIAAYGNRLKTGFLGTSILLDTLTRAAAAPTLAYTILLQHECPSWLYTVDNGGTTVWERWNSFSKKDGFGPASMNSFNHYAYGSVLAWMVETMAGIRSDPAVPGFKHFFLAPRPDRRLGAVAAEYESVYGRISSSWKYAEDGTIGWDFTIPANTSATVVKLDGTKAEYVAGSYHLDLPSEDITVDFKTKTGVVKPVHGVGQPPMVGLPRKPLLMHYLKEAGIPFSRLHDVGGRMGGSVYVDIPNLFPDFDADELDPANYRFAFTDRLMEELVANQVEPYFRLGVTIENYPDIDRYRILPPKDYAKWARICEQVIRHYTEGWAKGYKMKIRYWEIWNEPDSYPDPKDSMMWYAPFEEYCKLYEVAAKHLKAKFPELKFGGFACCGFYELTGNLAWANAKDKTRFSHFIKCFQDFLKYVKSSGTPLDFFSWHCYAPTKDCLKHMRYVRQELDRYGFTATETSLNEWLTSTDTATRNQAAEVAATLLACQNGPVDTAMIYDARCGIGQYSPLFDPATYQPRPAYWCFKAFNELYRRKHAVKALCQQSDIYVAAAENAGEGVVMVVNNRTQAYPLNFVTGDWKITKAIEVAGDHAYRQTEIPTFLSPKSVYLFTFSKCCSSVPPSVATRRHK